MFWCLPSEMWSRSIISGHHVCVCDLICCEWSRMCVTSVCSGMVICNMWYELVCTLCVWLVCSGMVTCGVWYKIVCTLCVWVVYYVWFVLCSRVCIWLVCVSDVWWWYVLCGKVCVWLVCVSDVLCVSWLAARFQLHLSILLSISKNEVTRTRFMTHSDPVGPVTIKGHAGHQDAV